MGLRSAFVRYYNEMLSSKKYKEETSNFIFVAFNVIRYSYENDMMQEMEESLLKFMDMGYRIAVFIETGESASEAKSIISNFKSSELRRLFITNHKLKAALYIDRKGLRFEDWEHTVYFVRLMRARGFG